MRYGLAVNVDEYLLKETSQIQQGLDLSFRLVAANCFLEDASHQSMVIQCLAVGVPREAKIFISSERFRGLEYSLLGANFGDRTCWVREKVKNGRVKALAGILNGITYIVGWNLSPVDGQVNDEWGCAGLGITRQAIFMCKRMRGYESCLNLRNFSRDWKSCLRAMLLCKNTFYSERSLGSGETFPAGADPSYVPLPFTRRIPYINGPVVAHWSTVTLQLNILQLSQPKFSNF